MLGLQRNTLYTCALSQVPQHCNVNSESTSNEHSVRTAIHVMNDGCAVHSAITRPFTMSDIWRYRSQLVATETKQLIKGAIPALVI